MQDILWMVLLAMVAVGYGLVHFVWRLSRRDSEAKQKRSAAVAQRSGAGESADAPLPVPHAEVIADAPEAVRPGLVQSLKFVFLPGRRNRVLALEVGNYVTAATMSAAESRVAGQLGIAPLLLVAQRRYLLAGAIRSIFVEFEQRGNAPAAAVRQLLEANLRDFFVARTSAGAGAAIAGLETAYATYGSAERPRVALAFFRSLRGDEAGADDMGRFPDFIALFDGYAKDIERFLKPRIAWLAAR